MDPAAPATPSLKQALDKARHLRQVIQVRIVNLGHAGSVFDKMQHGRLVSAAVIDLLEAQSELESAMVAAIGELQAAVPVKEGASHGA